MAVEADTIAKAKSRLDALQGEVSARFKEEVTAAYDRAGKVSGVVRIPLPDGYELTADAKKAIKWDSAKLLQVARFMEREQVQRPFKLEVSMGEKIYDGVAAAAPALREKIDVARTVAIKQIGRAPVCTPVTNAHLVCSLMLA